MPLEIPAGLRAESGDTTVIVYDGECPFCSNYATVATLRLRIGEINLVDARWRPDINAELLRAGINLDTGMAVLHAGRVYCGAEAVQFLSVHSEQRGLWDGVMSNARAARLLYPVLRVCRNAVLMLLGKSKLNG